MTATVQKSSGEPRRLPSWPKHEHDEGAATVVTGRASGHREPANDPGEEVRRARAALFEVKQGGRSVAAQAQRRPRVTRLANAGISNCGRDLVAPDPQIVAGCRRGTAA